jgi:hypothetical protein
MTSSTAAGATPASIRGSPSENRPSSLRAADPSAMHQGQTASTLAAHWTGTA